MTEETPTNNPAPRGESPRLQSISGKAEPAATPPPKVNYQATLYPGERQPIPPVFARAVQRLEEALEMPVWLLVQNEGNLYGRYDELNERVREAFFEARHEVAENGPVTPVIDSPGGLAKSAYQIATLLRRHCRGFTAIVPRYAKSAATLLALGADNIILGADAELGPLDAQLSDPEREDIVSALDEVQSLERLHAFALEQLDQSMFLLSYRTRKRLDTLLPLVLRFEADMMRPLLDKIDTVHYTQMSRVLKVAEEYAIRLLTPNVSL